MSRPRLPYVITYFQSLANQGVEEAKELIQEYTNMQEDSGEFIAARFIMEVYEEVQQELNSYDKETHLQ
jgi:hypothetical protein